MSYILIPWNFEPGRVKKNFCDILNPGSIFQFKLLYDNANKLDILQCMSDHDYFLNIPNY